MCMVMRELIRRKWDLYFRKLKGIGQEVEGLKSKAQYRWMLSIRKDYDNIYGCE